MSQVTPDRQTLVQGFGIGRGREFVVQNWVM